MDPKKYLKNEEEEALSPETEELDAASPFDKLVDILGIDEARRDEFEAALLEAIQSIVDGDVPTEEG